MRFLAYLTIVALPLGPAMPHLWGVEAAGAPPISIGLLLPPEETLAASLRQGVQLGVDHANQAAGTKVSLWVRGRVGQWGADGEEAGRMVLDDGVRGLIAPPGGTPSHLALQVAGRTATPVISLCPDSSVVGAGVPWMVRIVPSTGDEARLLFRAFPTNAAGRAFRWSALVSSERAGREASRDLLRAAQAAGRLLDKPVEASPELNDFSESRAHVLATQPDGILLWLEATSAGDLAKSLRAAGFQGRLAGPSRLQSTDFTAHAGSAAEGFMLPSSVIDPTSLSVATLFDAEYHQQFACEPDPTARLAYDAAVLLTNLLRVSGENPTRLAFPVRTEQPGASGSLKFDRYGNRIVRLELRHFQSGHFIPLGGKEPALFNP